MAKAILVLDEMPKRCADCPALRGADEYCNASGITPTLIEDIFTRPDCCPLKELPEESGRDQLVTRLIDLLGQLDHVSNKLDELISEI